MNGLRVRAEAAEASEAAAHKSGEAWFQHMKAEFDPVSSAPPTTAVLDFEKPLVELDRRIREVRRIVDPIGADCFHRPVTRDAAPSVLEMEFVCCIARVCERWPRFLQLW
jgi:hypothetical protein